MNHQDLRYVFTKHAIGRLEQSDLDLKLARRYLKFAQKVNQVRSDKEREYKDEKHGNNEGVFYMQYGPYVYTCRIQENKFNPEETILLVITFTDQRQTVKMRQSEAAKVEY